MTDDDPKPDVLVVPHCWVDGRCIRCFVVQTTAQETTCRAKKLSMGGW